MIKRLIVYRVLLPFFSISACAQDSNRTNITNYAIAGTRIKILSTCFSTCNPPVLFINLHDDENTAIEAAEIFLSANGGHLIQLVHTEKRLISFITARKKYTFDPNRVFTKAGRIATLKMLSSYNAVAEKLVGNFARHLETNYLQNKKLVVAVHNNTDEKYSVLTYANDPVEKRNASKIYINQNMDIDDFILTNDPEIFEWVMERDINVVLQNNDTVRDDGSLSVYAAQNNIPFINVEAQFGHLDEQLRILEAIKELVRIYNEEL